jgi:hypothetical protein
MHKTRSYARTSHKDQVRKVVVDVKRTWWKKFSKDWTDLNKYWWDTVRWNMKQTGRMRAESTSEQVGVGRLEQEERSRVWQPEAST